MAIVTISRIQHRRGLGENLPTLSSAELGWSIDERKLYIGNGSVSEGSPEEGNTEILTEHSDILSVAQTYTFKNDDAGYNVTTGPTINAPVIRTLQHKLDDFVSVRDFGATGDGVTDDTAAINRALYELYCREIVVTSRKTLHFPAGTYKISGVIKVPPYATLIGEGPFSTIIQQTGNVNTVGPVFKTADSKQQIEGSIGTNGASLPSDIYISDMGLTCNLHGIYIDKCKRITLRRVRMTGVDSLPTTTNTSAALTSPAPSIGIYILGSVVNPSEDINLEDIYLTKFNYGIWQNNTNEFFQNVVISSATFKELYEGILIGITGGSAKNVVVTSSVFDYIYHSAIDVNNASDIASSFNHYREVGNENAGPGSPNAPVINFGLLTAHSASVGDLFDRSVADDLAVETVSGNTDTAYFNYGRVIGIGYLGIESGREVTLGDGALAASTGLAMNLSRYKHAQITYHIERSSQSRSGILNIAFDGASGYSIDDDYTETGATGVTFDVGISGLTATLKYTTTATGDPATLRYSVKRLSSVV